MLNVKPWQSTKNLTEEYILKIKLSLLITLTLFLQFKSHAEIQLGARGPFIFRVHYSDLFYTMGFGPLLKKKLHHKLYINSKVEYLESGEDLYNYNSPRMRAGELLLLVKRNENWTIGPIGGLYMFEKKNFISVDDRDLVFFNKMTSVGGGIFLRYTTRADYHFIAKGVVAPSIGAQVTFPPEINYSARDIDHYDTSYNYRKAVYKESYLDMLSDYEKDREIYAVPVVLSLSAHKNLNFLSCAIGLESILIPYIPKNKDMENGLYHKLTGYVSIGVRIFKKRNPALPFVF